MWYTRALNLQPGNEHVISRISLSNSGLAIDEVAYDKLISDADENLKAGRIQVAKKQYLEALEKKPDNKSTIMKLDSLDILIQLLLENEINNNLVPVRGGTYTMGSNIASDDQKPEHPVTLSSFNIDKYEVTVKQYRLYCEITGMPMPKKPSWDLNDNTPVVNVSKEDAEAYARWREKDFRLRLNGSMRPQEELRVSKIC